MEITVTDVHITLLFAKNI